MKKICAVIFSLLLICVQYKAQQSLPDSLKKIAARVSLDSSAKLYVKIANIFTGVNSDSVRKYARIADGMADRNSVAAGDVLIQLGNSYQMENKVDSSLRYYQKALHHFQTIGNEKGIGKVYQSFGIVKRSLGDIMGAIEDDKKALNIYIKLKWELGIINTYNNISIGFLRLQKYEEAVKYSRAAFSRSRGLNDSLKYYSMMAEYGGRLAYTPKADSGLYYINKATPFFERNNMYNFLIPAYNNLASLLIYSKSPNLDAAQVILYKAKNFSVLSGAIENLRYVYSDFTLLYLKKGKADSADFYFRKTIAVIDSLAVQNGVQLSKEIETKYETEKKELLLEKQAVEIDASQKESEAKNKLLLYGAIALLIIAISGFFAFVNYLKVKRFNRIISEQKREVEDQKERISLQKEVIEIKQKEIIDSITYARRIQRAVLTGADVWSRISADYFILFKPKDIVSGDFYWAYNAPGNISVFTLADCTGHGVPGGFMSMLGNSFLNDIIVENKIYNAAEILNRLRKKIISALEQEGVTEQKDGMDISLCVWNKNDNTIEFAGANNSLLLSGKEGITEIKADRMPVGNHAGEMMPFRANTFTATRGDILYLVTDGFADQFGGSLEKKFSQKQLKNVLLKCRDETMTRQKEILYEVLNSWQKNFEQVDDISIIGIRL